MSLFTPDQLGGILLGLLFIASIGIGTLIDRLRCRRTRLTRRTRRQTG